MRRTGKVASATDSSVSSSSSTVARQGIEATAISATASSLSARADLADSSEDYPLVWLLSRADIRPTENRQLAALPMFIESFPGKVLRCSCCFNFLLIQLLPHDDEGQHEDQLDSKGSRSCASFGHRILPWQRPELLHAAAATDNSKDMSNVLEHLQLDKSKYNHHLSAVTTARSATLSSANLKRGEVWIISVGLVILFKQRCTCMPNATASPVCSLIV